MATLSSILAWRIPWTEEPGRLQFMGSQKLGHDCSDIVCMHPCMWEPNHHHSTTLFFTEVHFEDIETQYFWTLNSPRVGIYGISLTKEVRPLAELPLL